MKAKEFLTHSLKAPERYAFEMISCKEVAGLLDAYLAHKIEEAEKSNPFLAVSEEDGTYIKAFMKAQSDGYNAALNKLKEL